MKKYFFVVVGFLFLSTQLNAIELVAINESVSLEVLDKEYVIDIKSPYCEERVVELNSIYGSKKFSKIVFGKNSESISLIYDKQDDSVDAPYDFFDYVEGNGIPNIPFLTLNLQIPQDAKYDVVIKDITYRDPKSGEVSTDPIPYHLEYPYVPCQELFVDEEVKDIQMDWKVYSRDVFNNIYTISEPYGTMGTTGITLNISPFIYMPAEQAIILIHSATFVVTIDSPVSLLDMMDSELSEKVAAASGAYIYDNYLGTTKKQSDTIDKGRYLIITTSDKYADALTPYITHKRNIGYDVMLHVQNDGYPHDSIALRNYIKSMYDNIGSRPQFVLLVGDYSQLPVSYGELECKSDPPTDIYYACLEKSEIGCETNFYPEVYIGRWPISSCEDILKIADKVIHFEQTTNYSRRFELYSGTGNYSSIFESDNNKAAKKIKKIHLADVQNFKGSEDGIDGDFMHHEFVDYNVLMAIYNGHGSKSNLGSPYRSISTSTISSMVNTPYYMVSFACLLNHPQISSFGPTWLRDGYRTIAYYGSTVTTTTSSDSYLSKHIFDYFSSHTENLRYAQIMEYSAGRYYNALKNSYRKRETQKYLFLGDPTLFSLGMTGYNGNPKAYIKSHNDVEQNYFVLRETEQIKTVSIYNTLGQILLQSDGSSICSISDLQSLLLSMGKGVYIISVKTTENDYIRKITYK